MQGATTLLKVISLLALAVLGLFLGDGDLGHLAAGRALAEQRPGVLAVALLQIAYAYSGWNAAAYLAGEIRRPERWLPLSLIGGCLAVTCLYLLINVTYAYAIAPGSLAALPDRQVQRVAELAATRLFDDDVGKVLVLVVGIGLLASLSAFILTGPRVAFAMAHDKMLPAFFSRVHSARGTPVLATALQAGLALVVLWSGSFDAIVVYAGAGMSLLAGLVMLSVFPLRRRRVLPGAFSTPLFPLPPLLYLAVLFWMVGQAIGERPAPTLLGIASILAMWPVYWVTAAVRGRRARS